MSPDVFKNFLLSLIYNIGLIIAVQQGDSVLYIYIHTHIHTHIYIHTRSFHILLLCNLSPDIEYSLLRL